MSTTSLLRNQCSSWKELDRLEAAGILKKVNHSDWAAPIVPVPKKDGTVYVGLTRCP